MGLAISMLGTNLTNFGIGVWVYEQAASIQEFSWILIAGVFPIILLAPLAGTFADRWSRKKILMIGQIGALFSTLAIVSMYLGGTLTPFKIIIVVIISSSFSAFVVPAFVGSVPLLVKAEDLGRANGGVVLLTTISTAAAPALAGIIIDSQGINVLFVVDFLSFFVGIIALSLTKIPMPEKAEAQLEDAQQEESVDAEIIKAKNTGFQVFADVKKALRYLRNKPGLLDLLSVAAVLQFNLGAITVLFLPVVLGFASKTDFGLIQSSSVIGFVLGGLLLMIWGGPKRKLDAALFFACLVALAVCVTPMFNTVSVFVAGAIVIAFSMSVSSTSSAVVWQKKIALNMQASVVGVRMSLAKLMSLLGLVVSGYLADAFFEPAMMEGGLLADTFIGETYGLGQGRGAALLMSILGIFSFIILVIAWVNPNVRLIEDRLPDYLDKSDLDQLE